MGYTNLHFMLTSLCTDQVVTVTYVVVFVADKGQRRVTTDYGRQTTDDRRHKTTDDKRQMYE